MNAGLLAAAAVLVIAAGAAADEPRAPAAPERIVRYYESGEYAADVKEATRGATRSLTAQLADKPHRPAMVLDIDDTLESTYACAKRSNFDRTAITVCQARLDQTPIRPVWSLVRLAQRRNVAIVVITARPQGLEAGTRKQLKDDGLKGRYTLVMRPDAEFGKPAAAFKTAARRAIQKRGYSVLVNVGDQRSDLVGGYAVKRVKVPNPMYVSP